MIRYDADLRKLFAARPPLAEVDSADESMAGRLFTDLHIHQPAHTGVLSLKFGFMTASDITQQRYVKGLPIYPYDHEINQCDLE